MSDHIHRDTDKQTSFSINVNKSKVRDRQRPRYDYNDSGMSPDTRRVHGRRPYTARGSYAPRYSAYDSHRRRPRQRLSTMDEFGDVDDPNHNEQMYYPRPRRSRSAHHHTRSPNYRGGQYRQFHTPRDQRGSRYGTYEPHNRYPRATMDSNSSGLDEPYHQEQMYYPRTHGRQSASHNVRSPHQTGRGKSHRAAAGIDKSKGKHRSRSRHVSHHGKQRDFNRQRSHKTMRNESESPSASTSSLLEGGTPKSKSKAGKHRKVHNEQKRRGA